MQSSTQRHSHHSRGLFRKFANKVIEWMRNSLAIGKNEVLTIFLFLSLYCVCVLLCLFYFVLSLQWFSLFQFNNNTIWNCKKKKCFFVLFILHSLHIVIVIRTTKVIFAFLCVFIIIYHHHNHHFKCLCEHCRILKLRLKIFSMRIVIGRNVYSSIIF